MAEKNIYLIGPRASGKTSVGRLLAKKLARPFQDTDQLIVESIGMDISQYVESHGWDAFRDREAEVLADVSNAGGLVVGCGGGIVLREKSRELLSDGTVLYLKVTPAELRKRLSLDPNQAQRPSLTGKSIVDETLEIVEQRQALYEQQAHIILGPGTLPEIVDEAIAQLGIGF